MLRALGHEVLDVVPRSGVFRRPAAASSRMRSTVSWESFLFVPMTPDGPALDPAVTYSPVTGAPLSSQMRPPSLRIRPRRSSNGTPRQRHPAVADRAEDQARGDLLALPVPRAAASRRGGPISLCSTRTPLTGPDGRRPAPRASSGTGADGVRLPAGGRAAYSWRISTLRREVRSASWTRRRAERVELASADDLDVGPLELAELQQLGVRERGLRRPAAAEHEISVTPSRAAPRARGRRRRSPRARRGRAPACARRPSPRCRCRPRRRGWPGGRPPGPCGRGGRCTRRRTRWRRASRRGPRPGCPGACRSTSRPRRGPRGSARAAPRGSTSLPSSTWPKKRKRGCRAVFS